MLHPIIRGSNVQLDTAIHLQPVANVEGPEEEPLDEEAAAIEEQIAEEEEAIIAEEEVRTNEQ